MSADLSTYYHSRAFSATLGGQAIQIISKPGIPDWDGVSPAQVLLADAIRPPEGARVLLLRCGHGALGVALARQAGAVVLLDSNWIALTMAQRTLQANGVMNASVCATISVLPEQEATFDIVALVAPNDRRLTRRWLVEAYGALKAGGELFIAGANDHGIRSAVGDAEALFGSAHVLGYKRGNRVARATKAPGRAAGAAWAGEAGIAPGTWFEFETEARGYPFLLRSLPGVFAHDHLDAGTALLLESLAIPQGARVLDVGCGSGIIGLLAARLGAAQVEMVDVNLLAVAAATENIARAGIANARAFASDGVPEGSARRYDAVISNPPFHVGRSIDYDVARAFIERATRALMPGGQLILVANQFLRYDQVLRPAFEQVICLASNRSYNVWSATNRAVV
ncbi:MAG TPA: methyltransferase [Roseiflexaceae bacterium]|nr:methyltransferase [Roseiflexaceae bacterium]